MLGKLIPLTNRGRRAKRALNPVVVELAGYRLAIEPGQAALLDRLSETRATATGNRLEPRGHDAPCWLVGLDVDIELAFGPDTTVTKKAPWIMSPDDPLPNDSDDQTGDNDDVAAITAMNRGVVLAIDVRHYHLVEAIVQGRAEPVGPAISALRHLRTAETVETDGRSLQGQIAKVDQ